MSEVDILAWMRRHVTLNAQGFLVWENPPGNRVRKGNLIGAVSAQGYRYVKVMGKKTYLVHRLVWLWHHGKFPEQQIDHIDRDRQNNHIDNLREVDDAGNRKNQKMNRTNTSGVTGVSWYKARGLWRAVIGGKFLGYFEKKSDAITARLKAERKLGYDPKHGRLTFADLL